jgi:hypothetical protein
MRITESQLRRIIREEITSSMHESFLSKTADFFGSRNKSGRDVKERAARLLQYPDFDEWNNITKLATDYERKLRDITKMGEHTAAEELELVQGAEKMYKEWSKRQADAWHAERKREYQDDLRRRNAKEAERVRKHKELEKEEELAREREIQRKLDDELIAVGVDASDYGVYTTRADYERQARENPGAIRGSMSWTARRG